MCPLFSDIAKRENVKLLTLNLEQDSEETPLIRAERYRLRNWLSTNLPIQWGKRLQRVEHDDQGVTAYFEDGTSAKGDILVGADGVKSIGMSLTPKILLRYWLFAITKVEPLPNPR